LEDLGRDIAKTIIVDNMPENFSANPDNGFMIRSWYSDPEDKALLSIAPILVEIGKQ
jgi:CTD small phosphatase-like protein 2